jgi:S-DNA-T family DNA segregation ATPase FtsK/SpoIIIE
VACALALGFAIPARADDAPPTSPSPAPTVTAPTPPDTSQAVAAADAAAAQLGAANLDVSVRIDSPGDNGAVTQTIAAQSDAAQTATQTADTAQATSAQADTTQVAPTNVAVSVRIASPGTDGPVTQTSTAGAAAQTAAPDIAPPAGGTAAAPSAASAEAPVTQTAVAAQPAPVTTGGASVPSVWTWNWTWTCGDTTAPGTTRTIDTGIQGWIWTWNIDTTCATVPAASTAPDPIIPVESGGIISPVPPTHPTPVSPVPPVAPDPPQLPQVTEPQLPLPPDVVAPVLPFADASDAPSVTYEVVPAQAPAAELIPSVAAGELVTRPRPELAPKPKPPLPWLAAEVSARAEPPGAPQARKHAQPTRRAHATERAPLEVLAFPPLPGGGSAAGGTGGSGTGAVAALAVWMLLQLPGLAVLRLPPSRRSPRARVDEIRNRPG